MKHHIFKTLYIRRSTTTVSRYTIHVDETKEGAAITRYYGVLGKQAISNSTLVTKGTNIGRANARTPYDVAISNAKASISKKLQAGYKEVPLEDIDKLPIEHIGIYANLLPMKAVHFIPGRVEYPAAAQAKINGVRGTLGWETVVSGEGMFKTESEQAIIRAKHGTVYYMPHITEDLTKEDFLLPDGTLAIYDGELYIHGRKVNYIKSSCPVVLDNGLPSKAKHDYRPVQFITFDLSIPDVIQIDRLDLLEKSKIGYKTNIIHLKYTIVNSDEEVYKLRDTFIANGYEGVIIRQLDADYQFGKKNKTMRKLKKVYYTTCKLIDIIEATDSSNRINIVYKLRNDLNERIFKCTPLGDNKDRREILTNKDKYIGKMCEVKYGERSGVGNFPYHANVTRIL